MGSRAEGGLTPDKSGASGGGSEATPEAEDSFEENLKAAKRSSSTLARFKRSVTKLGSRGREKAEKPAKKVEKSSTFAFGRRRAAAAPSSGGDGVKGASADSPRAAATPALRRVETLPHAPSSGSLQMARGSGGTGDLAVPSDAAAATAARIRLFEEGRFNVEAGLGSLTEKARRGAYQARGRGVESLRADLASLDAEVGEQLKRAVHEHYADFVKATPALLRLEGDAQQLRGSMARLGQLIASLEGVSAAVAAAQAAAAPAAGGGPGSAEPVAAAAGAGRDAAWRASSEGAKWHEYLDEADVALAERRAPEALALLRKLDKLLARLRAAAAAGEGGAGPAAGAAAALERLDSLEVALAERRGRLVPLIAGQLVSPLATPADMRRAAQLLAEAAGARAAHADCLRAYAARLRRAQEGLLTPASAGGGDPEGADYAAALGQRLAAAVAGMVGALEPLFGNGRGDGGACATADEARALASVRVLWALQQTEAACVALRKHALLPFAAPAGLGAAARCAAAFLAFASAAGMAAGLPLEAAALAELAPTLAGVAAKRARRLGEQLRRAVVAEVDRLSQGTALLPTDLASWDCLAQALPSADFLLDGLAALAADLRRLPPHHRLWAAARRAATELYSGYTSALASALLRGLKYAEGEAAAARAAGAAEVAMEAATVLAERLLAEALAPLSEAWGGEVVDGDAAAAALEAMANALGFAALPLTPSGGDAVPVPGAQETVAGQQQEQRVQRAAALPAGEDSSREFRRTSDE